MTLAAISLCDVTGNMLRPWAEAGFECFAVDIEHLIRKPVYRDGINYVWGDCRSWTPPKGIVPIFVAAFPPCTHVSVSGTRDHATKRGQMLRDALETFEACRLAAAWSGAPYMIENPVGILSSIPHIGKPDYYFHPHDYTAFELGDHYTKKTCLWTGNGFVMPTAARDPSLQSVKPDDRIHKAPPTKDRADIRSETPIGFARAVFQANNPRQIREAAE